MLNGFSKTMYMTLDEMASYALRYSPSFKGRNKPTKEALIKIAQENAPTGKVGWEGNFNDMALKTVLRRLLGKYGYLSVEMQEAVSGDVRQEQAQAQRNDDIEDTNVVEVDTDAEVVEVETVDAEAAESEELPY